MQATTNLATLLSLLLLSESEIRARSPGVYGVLRGCDDGEERDDHANGVMIKTKKIPRTGGETENKSSKAKFIPTNSMPNF